MITAAASEESRNGGEQQIGKFRAIKVFPFLETLFSVSKLSQKMMRKWKKFLLKFSKKKMKRRKDN